MLLLDRVGKLVVKAVWKLAYKQILVSICKRSKASKAPKGFIWFYLQFYCISIISFINFCSDSFDIFGTFFTSVKFFASCTPVFYLFDTRFPLLCYQNDRKCQKCQLCHVIFYPSFFFFERSIQKLSVSCF